MNYSGQLNPFANPGIQDLRSSNPNPSQNNPFSSGTGLSRTPLPYSSSTTFTPASALLNSNSRIPAPSSSYNHNTSSNYTNPTSSFQTSNPFNPGVNTNPYSSSIQTGPSPFGTGGAVTPTNPFSGPQNSFSQPSGGMNQQFLNSGQNNSYGAGNQQSFYSGNRPATGATNPFSAANSMTGVSSGANPFAGSTIGPSSYMGGTSGASSFTGGNFPGTGIGTNSFTGTNPLSNPFSSSNSAPNPFSSNLNTIPVNNSFSGNNPIAAPLVSSNPFSNVSSNPVSNSYSGVMTGTNTNPFSSTTFPSSSTSSFFANPISNPSTSVFPATTSNFPTTSSLYPSNSMTSLGIASNPNPYTNNFGYIGNFSGQFEEPSAWRYKKVDQLGQKMKEMIVSMQKIFDTNENALVDTQKRMKDFTEKTKLILENAKKVLGYSRKVSSVQKRIKLSVEIRKKYQNDVVKYVKELIKVCESCEKADYYNQVSSPAEFLSGFLQLCDERLVEMEEGLKNIEEIIAVETDSNNFKSFIETVNLMQETFKVVAGFTYDTHLMVNAFYESQAYKYKELQYFVPNDGGPGESEIKTEVKNNKENAPPLQFRPSNNIRDVISGVPSHFVLK